MKFIMNAYPRDAQESRVVPAPTSLKRCLASTVHGVAVAVGAVTRTCQGGACLEAEGTESVQNAEI